MSTTYRDRMVQTSGYQYFVNRPLYTEDAFTEDYEKVYRQRKTILDHVKQYFR